MNRTFVMTICFCCMVTAAMAAAGKAVIKGTADRSQIAGEVSFVEEKGGLTVKAVVSNLPPGKHGFHLHENPGCAEGGKAAGGHFNPDKAMHGYLPKDGMEHAHAGDMGNIDVDDKGNGTSVVFMPGLTLTDGQYAVSGRSVIVHEKTDDFGQPTGNAGGRIACGIVETIASAK